MTSTVATPAVDVPAAPPAMTAEQLLAALGALSPEVLAAALKGAKDTEAAQAAKKFLALGMDDTIAKIREGYALETWYKRDPKTKEKTDVVSGTGYHVMGETTIVNGDNQQVVKVDMWIRLKETAPLKSA